MITRLGSKSGIRHVPYGIAYERGFEDMPRRLPSLERITALTGWKSQTLLDTSIEIVARHMQEKTRGIAVGRQSGVAAAGS